MDKLNEQKFYYNKSTNKPNENLFTVNEATQESFSMLSYHIHSYIF